MAIRSNERLSRYNSFFLLWKFRSINDSSLISFYWQLVDRCRHNWYGDVPGGCSVSLEKKWELPWLFQRRSTVCVFIHARSYTTRVVEWLLWLMNARARVQTGVENSTAIWLGLVGGDDSLWKTSNCCNTGEREEINKRVYCLMIFDAHSPEIVSLSIIRGNVIGGILFVSCFWYYEKVVV